MVPAVKTGTLLNECHVIKGYLRSLAVIEDYFPDELCLVSKRVGNAVGHSFSIISSFNVFSYVTVILVYGRVTFFNVLMSRQSIEVRITYQRDYRRRVVLYLYLSDLLKYLAVEFSPVSKIIGSKIIDIDLVYGFVRIFLPDERKQYRNLFYLGSLIFISFTVFSNDTLLAIERYVNSEQLKTSSHPH